MIWRSDSGRLCYPDSFLDQSNKMNPETTAVVRTFVCAVALETRQIVH